MLEAGDVVYLFLPLAHSYALLIQLLAIDLGAHDRLLRRRPEADRARADGGPADLPAVGAADLREDLHARHRPTATPSRSRRATQRRPEGARAAGRRPGGPRRAAGRTSTQADEALFKNVRDVVRRPAQAGDHRRRADRAGDPRVLLRLRRAGARGLRDDRDRDGRHDLDGRRPPVRLGRPRAPGLRDPDRRRRRDPASRARTSSGGYYKNDDAVASARSSTAGCTPATSARSTRTASSPSPAARRTSSSPRAARTSRRPTSRTTSSSRAGSPRP